MLQICEQIGIDFTVTFNSKKTQFICFIKSNECGTVTLNHKVHKWEFKVNDLGNILNQ